MKRWRPCSQPTHTSSVLHIWYVAHVFALLRVHGCHKDPSHMRAIQGLTCGCKVQVLLLDEVTVDLDVLGRADLLRFLQVGSCFVYSR